MADVRLTATNPQDSSVVPVACNSRGELLLEEPLMIEGDVGPPGPPGPEGPPGKEFEAEQGYWIPSYASSGSGQAIIDYSVQQGYWYKVGGMLTVWWLLQTREVAILEPRGSLDIVGLPESFELNGSSALRQGQFSVGEWGGLKPQDINVPFIRLAGQGNIIRLFKRTIPNETAYQFSDLDENNMVRNNCGGAWTGLTSTAFLQAQE